MGCVPIIHQIGTRCREPGAPIVQETDPNMPAPAPGPAPVPAPAPKEVDAVTTAAPMIVAEAAKVEAVAVVKQPMMWDLRPLVAGRLRAEAGAAMAHAAASGEQVRVAAHTAHRNVGFLGLLKPAAVAAAGSLVAGAASAEASSSTSLAAADEATAVMKQAEKEAPELFKSARELALKQIEAIAGPAADAEAQAYARRMAWDKPPSYGKLVAYRAAEPYGQMAAVALQRVSQYEARAAGLVKEAQEARESVKLLPKHAEAMEALGDRLGAANERQKAQAMLGKAEAMDEEAVRSKSIAQDARNAEERWRHASEEALSNAWGVYTKAHGPPQMGIA
jgi:hypothetical protein